MSTIQKTILTVTVLILLAASIYFGYLGLRTGEDNTVMPSRGAATLHGGYDVYDDTELTGAQVQTALTMYGSVDDGEHGEVSGSPSDGLTYIPYTESGLCYIQNGGSKARAERKGPADWVKNPNYADHLVNYTGTDGIFLNDFILYHNKNEDSYLNPEGTFHSTLVLGRDMADEDLRLNYPDKVIYIKFEQILKHKNDDVPEPSAPADENIPDAPTGEPDEISYVWCDKPIIWEGTYSASDLKKIVLAQDKKVHLSTNGVDTVIEENNWNFKNTSIQLRTDSLSTEQTVDIVANGRTATMTITVVQSILVNGANIPEYNKRLYPKESDTITVNHFSERYNGSNIDGVIYTFDNVVITGTITDASGTAIAAPIIYNNKVFKAESAGPTFSDEMSMKVGNDVPGIYTAERTLKIHLTWDSVRVGYFNHTAAYQYFVSHYEDTDANVEQYWNELKAECSYLADVEQTFTQGTEMACKRDWILGVGADEGWQKRSRDSDLYEIVGALDKLAPITSKIALGDYVTFYCNVGGMSVATGAPADYGLKEVQKFPNQSAVPKSSRITTFKTYYAAQQNSNVIQFIFGRDTDNQKSVFNDVNNHSVSGLCVCGALCPKVGTENIRQTSRNYDVPAGAQPVAIAKSADESAEEKWTIDYVTNGSKQFDITNDNTPVWKLGGSDDPKLGLEGEGGCFSHTQNGNTLKLTVSAQLVASRDDSSLFTADSKQGYILAEATYNDFGGRYTGVYTIYNWYPLRAVKRTYFNSDKTFTGEGVTFICSQSAPDVQDYVIDADVKYSFSDNSIIKGVIENERMSAIEYFSLKLNDKALGKYDGWYVGPRDMWIGTQAAHTTKVSINAAKYAKSLAATWNTTGNMVLKVARQRTGETAATSSAWYDSVPTLYNLTSANETGQDIAVVSDSTNRLATGDCFYYGEGVPLDTYNFELYKFKKVNTKPDSSKKIETLKDSITNKTTHWERIRDKDSYQKYDSVLGKNGLAIGKIDNEGEVNNTGCYALRYVPEDRYAEVVGSSKSFNTNTDKQSYYTVWDFSDNFVNGAATANKGTDIDDYRYNEERDARKKEGFFSFNSDDAAYYWRHNELPLNFAHMYATTYVFNNQNAVNSINVKKKNAGVVTVDDPDKINRSSDTVEPNYTTDAKATKDKQVDTNVVVYSPDGLIDGKNSKLTFKHNQFYGRTKAVEWKAFNDLNRSVALTELHQLEFHLGNLSKGYENIKNVITLNPIDGKELQGDGTFAQGDLDEFYDNLETLMCVSVGNSSGSKEVFMDITARIAEGNKNTEAAYEFTNKCNGVKYKITATVVPFQVQRYLALYNNGDDITWNYNTEAGTEGKNSDTVKHGSYLLTNKGKVIVGDSIAVVANSTAYSYVGCEPTEDNNNVKYTARGINSDKNKQLGTLGEVAYLQYTGVNKPKIFIQSDNVLNALKLEISNYDVVENYADVPIETFSTSLEPNDNGDYILDTEGAVALSTLTFLDNGISDYYRNSATGKFRVREDYRSADLSSEVSEPPSLWAISGYGWGYNDTAAKEKNGNDFVHYINSYCFANSKYAHGISYNALGTDTKWVENSKEKYKAEFGENPVSCNDGVSNLHVSKYAKDNANKDLLTYAKSKGNNNNGFYETYRKVALLANINNRTNYRVRPMGNHISYDREVWNTLITNIKNYNDSLPSNANGHLYVEDSIKYEDTLNWYAGFVMQTNCTDPVETPTPTPLPPGWRNVNKAEGAPVLTTAAAKDSDKLKGNQYVYLNLFTLQPSSTSRVQISYQINGKGDWLYIGNGLSNGIGKRDTYKVNDVKGETFYNTLFSATRFGTEESDTSYNGIDYVNGDFYAAANNNNGDKANNSYAGFVTFSESIGNVNRTGTGYKDPIYTSGGKWEFDRRVFRIDAKHYKWLEDTTNSVDIRVTIYEPGQFYRSYTYPIKFYNNKDTDVKLQGNLLQ